MKELFIPENRVAAARKDIAALPALNITKVCEVIIANHYWLAFLQVLALNMARVRWLPDAPVCVCVCVCVCVLCAYTRRYAPCVLVYTPVLEVVLCMVTTYSYCCFAWKQVLPESASKSVKELFVPDQMREAACKEADTLSTLDITKVCQLKHLHGGDCMISPWWLRVYDAFCC